MSTASHVVLLLAGVALYAGVYNILFYLRTRDCRERLSFAFLCFVIVLYDIFSIRLYDAVSFLEAVGWQRMQVIALAAGCVCMLWFTSEFIGRKERIADWAFTAYFTVQAAILTIDRSELTWTMKPATKELSFFGGMPLDVLEVEPGPLINIQSVVGLVACVYVLFSVFQHVRTSKNRSALPVACGILVLIMAATNDAAVSFRMYSFPYLIEYGFTALVLAMSSSLIAQHVSAERALRDSVEQMRQLATAVNEAAESVMITDSAGVITYVNPQFEKMTGFSRAEVIGRTPTVLKSGVHSPIFYRELWATLQAGGVWHGRITNRRKDGRLFEEQATISPVRDHDGHIVNYVAVKRDVTQETLLGNQARESQKMAAIGKFAHRIVHDVTNKLVAILGYAQITRDLVRHIPQAVQNIDGVIEAGNRISTLTAELLAFAHPAPLSVRRLRLGLVVQGAEELLRQSVPDNIRFTIDVSAASSCTVEVDPVQIEHVLLNLTLNAVDAMPNGGTLTIRANPVIEGEGQAIPLPPLLSQARGSRPVNYACITVVDTGEGMTDEVRSHIFEPFFTTHTNTEATGLGLATVFRIVEQHHGMITVDSAPRHGSTFRIYIPMTGDVAKTDKADVHHVSMMDSRLPRT